MARSKMRSTAPAIAGLWCRKGRMRFGTESHPLAHGKRRQDVIDEMGGGLDHAITPVVGTVEPSLAVFIHHEASRHSRRKVIIAR